MMRYWSMLPRCSFSKRSGRDRPVPWSAKLAKRGQDESRRTDVPLRAPQHFEKRSYPCAKGSSWPACRDVNDPNKTNENVGDLHFLSVAPFLKVNEPFTMAE